MGPGNKKIEDSVDRRRRKDRDLLPTDEVLDVDSIPPEELDDEDEDDEEDE